MMDTKPVNGWLVMAAVVSPVLMAPVMLLALAFGDRPDTVEVAPAAPVATLVAAEPTTSGCVMFCETPTSTATDPPQPALDADALCPPFCAFEEW
ncbi:hypothetical protein [Nocardia sp. NPDC050406]|uniref:hypothetical protein n=1 Tax=Nocardia sp. NPDC050406 TaxID=3364318 RepID=UPI00378E41BE